MSIISSFNSYACQ